MSRDSGSENVVGTLVVSVLVFLALGWPWVVLVIGGLF